MSPALFLLLLPAVAAAATMQPKCPTKCGDVDIPYPFGIGVRCFRSKGFEISCVNNGTMALLPSATHTIPVTSLSVAPEPAAKVNLPVAYKCYNTTTGAAAAGFDGYVDVNTHGAYRISNARNVFVVLGCNTGAFTMNSNSTGSGLYDHRYYMGCFTYCDGAGSAKDGRCASVGCCRVDIPPGLTDNVVQFEEWPHAGLEYGPCDIGFLVDRESYEFRASDLLMDVRQRSMPVWLDWAIRDGAGAATSCAAARNRTGYACVSADSECVDAVNGPGYFCRCKQGFEGNPYQEKNGCTNIDECARPEVYPCHGVCKDTKGSYECKCRSGYTTNGGDPKKQQCNPKFPLQAQLALGIPLGFSLLAVALLFTLMVRQKRRANELFKRNGGSVLQQLDNLRIFTREELKKITKNNSLVLGRGGSGHVYKGILEDGTLVAVKTAIEVDEARKEDFTNEVIVQSQMIHKNIIKLLGCCLEVDVPMLVYEFAPKGNLYDILHGNKATRHQPRLHLSLDLRLDIAAESAEGLKYMHSSTNNTIRHGDVKSANILLDENFMPKISDFGTSMLLSGGEDYFTMFVVGSMGYIDPVFSQTGLLTQKSDVYSFGVVLLELICRKTTIYDEHCSLVIQFRRVHEKNKSGRAMFDRDIAVTDEDVLVLEEIGRLAIECLEEEVEDRPDMKEVAERLVLLRRAKKHGQWSYGSPPHQHYEKNNVGGALTSFATDISRTSSSTVPLIQEMRRVP